MKVDIINTPTINEEIYKNLPDLISKCVSLFEEERQKDIVLTSVLTVLSGCFSRVKGNYDNNEVGPNLYSFIIAPPGSGKGDMKYSIQLGQVIQDEFLKERNKKRAEYEFERKKAGKNGNIPLPKCPVLFIPGNASSAAMYQILDESKGVNIMIETEADTVTSTLKRDWGGHSDVFRKAFHHEKLSITRKTNGEYIEIPKPYLSVLLSGTPNQVTKLIPSAEDGLSSRFLFYTFTSDWQWKNPAPCDDCPNFEQYFYNVGIEVAKIHKVLESGFYSFSLNTRQFEMLSESFEAKTRTLRSANALSVRGTVNRMGLICYKIAMILTVARKMANLPEHTELVCDDKDLEIALELCDIYMEHSMVIHKMLPQHSKVAIPSSLTTFYDMLPEEGVFSRKVANEIGSRIGISERTVGTYLDKLEKQILISSPQFGKFFVIKRESTE